MVVMVVLISYRLVLVSHHPCIFGCCCKFTFPLVNFHLCICQMKEKNARTYAVVCIRILLNRCVYHICRLSRLSPIFWHHPNWVCERKVYQWVDEWRIFKIWSDLWKIVLVFGMISKKIRLTHVRLFGASLYLSASDSPSSSISLSLNVRCCCGIFVSLV